jgi:hypothetical protein
MRAAVVVLLAACGGHSGTSDAPETIGDAPAVPTSDAPALILDGPVTSIPDAPLPHGDAPVAQLKVIMNGCYRCPANYLADPNSFEPICHCYFISQGEPCNIPVPAVGYLQLGWEGPVCAVPFCYIATATGCKLDAWGRQCVLWGDAGTVTLGLEVGVDTVDCAVDAGG